MWNFNLRQSLGKYFYLMMSAWNWIATSGIKWLYMHKHNNESKHAEKKCKWHERVSHNNINYSTHIQIPHRRPFRIVEDLRNWACRLQSYEVTFLSRFSALLLRPRHTIVIIETSLVMTRGWNRSLGYWSMLHMIMIINYLQLKRENEVVWLKVD